MQQLEGAFGGARIARPSAQIRIDDSGKRQLRKMIPLGDDLRADDDVDLARGKGADSRLSLNRAEERVAGSHRHARLGEGGAEFFLHALDSRTASDKGILSAALRAVFRDRGFVSAMMTHQPLAIAMFHHPRRTIATGL